MTLAQVGLFADGVAVAQIGVETFKVAQVCVDEVITCTTDEICAAIKDIFEDTRSIAEPAGALSLAGLKKYVAREKCEGKTLVAIDSGANMNFDRLRHISERPKSAKNAKLFLPSPFPKKQVRLKHFAKRLANAISLSLITAMPITKMLMFLSAFNYAQVHKNGLN